MYDDEVLELPLTHIFRNLAKNESLKITEFSNYSDSLDDPITSEGKKHAKMPLYVHIPFCKSLCPFCSFNRYLFNENGIRSYYKQLWKELEKYLDSGYKFSSINIGGGTPTVMMDELLLFIEKAKSESGVKRIEVESTPNEISDESVDALRNAGVKRLSVGIQTFDDKLLRDIGRSGYKGTEALDKLNIAIGKFDTLGIDLIFNFPTQSTDSLMKDLDIFKSSGIDQVTFYPLMPGPHKNTALERRFNRRSAHAEYTKETNFYNMLVNDLLAEGYHASSVWCFSKKNSDIGEYVFDNTEYVGIGSGAISLFSNMVYVDSFSLGRYAEFISNNSLPIIRYKRLEPREYYRYKLLFSLFGIEFDKPAEGSLERRIIGKEISILQFLGIVKEHNGRFRVTQKGMHYVSVMMEEFLYSLNRFREKCIENQI
ncbi:MAG: radical SAM protein [Candidatus Marsarchaeota archaeon]|nr:radical SAM protein [Candidatus Marsarchaeota archaeon]